MRDQRIITEFVITSPLTPRAVGWLCASALIAGLYLLRTLIGEIPPQDHFALSIILCSFLFQTWLQLEQTRLRMSLSHNRCWLMHHHLGTVKEQSMPVSQIHSARLEYGDAIRNTDLQLARIVLVTSLGMIPVSRSYSHRARLLYQNCNHINEFLESQKQFLQA